MHTNMMPANKSFYKNDDTIGSISFIFRINFLVVTRMPYPRLSGFTQKLIMLFVHTDNRNSWIVRNFINIKDIFHVCCKFDIRFAGEAPVVTTVRSKFAFLESADGFSANRFFQLNLHLFFKKAYYPTTMPFRN